MNTSAKQPVKAFSLLELLIVVTAIACVAFVFLERRSRAHAKGSPPTCVNNLKQIGLSFLLWAGDNGGKYPMQVAATNGGPAQQSAIADGTGAACMYQVFQVMSNELGTPKLTVCPEDKKRNIATNWDAHFDALGNAGISYFVGKDADATNPRQYLAGDRNIGLKPAQAWDGSAPGGGPAGFSPLYGKAGSCRSLAAYAKDPRLQWTDKLHQGKGFIVLVDGSVQQYTSSKMRADITNAGDAAWTYFP